MFTRGYPKPWVFPLVSPIWGTAILGNLHMPTVFLKATDYHWGRPPRLRDIHQRLFFVHQDTMVLIWKHEVN